MGHLGEDNLKKLVNTSSGMRPLPNSCLCLSCRCEKSTKITRKSIRKPCKRTLTEITALRLLSSTDANQGPGPGAQRRAAGKDLVPIVAPSINFFTYDPHMQTPSMPNAPSAEAVVTTGEQLPSLMRKIARELVGVAEDVNGIRTGKFEPSTGCAANVPLITRAFPMWT
ncbi:hypothetical protein E4U61_003321 [Claviceps capensis]|nr:hypothetical protein E4U61_003321 [Claviceps capensis]